MKTKKVENRGGKRPNSGRKKTLSKQEYKKLISIGVNPEDFSTIKHIKVEKNFKNYYQVIAYLLELYRTS